MSSSDNGQPSVGFYREVHLIGNATTNKECYDLPCEVKTEHQAPSVGNDEGLTSIGNDEGLASTDNDEGRTSTSNGEGLTSTGNDEVLTMTGNDEGLTMTGNDEGLTMTGNDEGLTITGNDEGLASTDIVPSVLPVSQHQENNISVADQPKELKPKVTRSQEKPDRFSKKRKRLTFSSSQLVVFERTFEKDHYPKRLDLLQIQRELNIPEHKLRTWFQNRRAKEKRAKLLQTTLEDRFLQDGDGGAIKQNVFGKPFQYVTPVKIPEYSERVLSQQMGQGFTETIRPGVSGFQLGSAFTPPNISTLGKPNPLFVHPSFVHPSSVSSPESQSPWSFSKYLFPRQTFHSQVGNSSFTRPPCCSPVSFRHPLCYPWNRDGGQNLLLSPPLTPSPVMWSPNSHMTPPLSGFPSFIPFPVNTKDSAVKENLSHQRKNNPSSTSLPSTTQTYRRNGIRNPYSSSSSTNPTTFWPGSMTSLRSPVFNTNYNKLNTQSCPLPVPAGFHPGFYSWGGYGPNGLYPTPLGITNMQNFPTTNVLPEILSPNETSDDD